MAVTGGCFCGAVRYAITAPLKAARSCHCSRCRKAFSGAGSAYAEIEPGSFAWTEGASNVVFYESTPGWVFVSAGCAARRSAALIAVKFTELRSVA